MALPKPKKESLSKLRVKAWAMFSKYIRLRDCERYQRNGMFAPCFTCGRLTHFKDLQAGHFVPGRGNAVLFDEEGVNAQCMQCNIFHHGNPAAYWEKMLIKYGVDRTFEISSRRKQTKLYTAQDYKDIISEYKNRVALYESTHQM